MEWGGSEGIPVCAHPPASTGRSTYQWPQARTLSTSPRSQGATCLSQLRQWVESESAESIEAHVAVEGGVGGLGRVESTRSVGASLGEISMSNERVGRGGGRLAARFVNDEGRVGCHSGRRVGRVPPVPSGVGEVAVPEKRRREAWAFAEGLSRWPNVRVDMARAVSY